MIDATVKRAVRQGAKTAAIEHKQGGARKRKEPFVFTPTEMADALQFAREQRADEDLAARELAP